MAEDEHGMHEGDGSGEAGDHGIATDPAPELQEALAETREALAARVEAERGLLERYRLALLASEPAIPPEMVGGETAEAIEASFAAAKALAGRLREGIAAEAARQVPAGAPGRARGAPLSAFEKIRQGLGAPRG
jgi:hypothetical protein